MGLTVFRRVRTVVHRVFPLFGVRGDIVRFYFGSGWVLCFAGDVGVKAFTTYDYFAPVGGWGEAVVDNVVGEGGPVTRRGVSPSKHPTASGFKS